MSNKKSDKLKFCVFIVIMLTAIIFVAFNWNTIRHLDIEKVVDFVKTKGPYAVVIYLLIFTLKPFAVVVPSNVIVICGAIVFGPFKGLLLAMAGFWISATVAFYVSRILGRDFVRGIIGDKFINLDKKLENSGFKIIFFLRVIPVLPYDPFSYACGFTNMKYFSFVIASVLGVLPETFCYCLMGKNAANPLSPQFLIPLGIIVVIALFSKKFFNMKEEKEYK